MRKAWFVLSVAGVLAYGALVVAFIVAMSKFLAEEGLP